MKDRFGLFDIIGPVMIGPSSSHTAGAVRIGRMAGQFCGYAPVKVEVFFHGSLANTYSFHKTDAGVLAGVLGMAEDDERIRDIFQIAEGRGVNYSFGTIALEQAHPSTIVIRETGTDGSVFLVRSATIGGGNIQIETINNCSAETDGKENFCCGHVSSQAAEELERQLLQWGEGVLQIKRFIRSEEDCYFQVVSLEPWTAERMEFLRGLEGVTEIYFLNAVMPLQTEKSEFYGSLEEIRKAAETEGCQMSDLMLRFEAESSGMSEDQVFERMRGMYRAMALEIEVGLLTESKLLAGLFQGNAARMDSFLNMGRSICGIELSQMVRNALSAMEVNGSMGRVVACPTAGSAGVVPAAVVTVAQTKDLEEDKIVKALFTGAGIGKFVAEQATISGSVGGCQAECGVASALGAAILIEAFGGTPTQVLHGVSLALGNLMGLTCDPVAGTVEVPCIQRNALGAANAVISAEMALAGVDSVIPADEMIGALDDVGRRMDVSLKDTLKGGISATPTAKAIERRLFGSNV